MALLLPLLRGRIGPAFKKGVWSRILHTSASSAEPAAPKPVALSKLKDSFNDATSGKV